MMRSPQNKDWLTSRRRETFGFGLAAAFLLVLFVVAFSSGRFAISFGDLLRLLWSKISGVPSGLPETVETVIFRVRGPRVLASMAVGATLAAAGAAYQGLFRNPLVSPDILGCPRALHLEPSWASTSRSAWLESSC
jgi:iron complex transport system permease protein